MQTFESVFITDSTLYKPYRKTNDKPTIIHKISETKFSFYVQ